MNKRIENLANMAFEAGYVTKEANMDARLEEGAAAKRAEYVAYTGVLEKDVAALQAAATGALGWMLTIIGAADLDGHVEITLDLAGLRESYKFLNDAIVKMRE